MSLAATIAAMEAAGAPADLILKTIKLMEQERLAKGRARTAKHRNTKANGDVTNVTRVTNVTSVTSPSADIKHARAHVGDNLLPIEGTGKKEPSLREGARARKSRTSIAADWSPAEAGEQYAIAHGMGAPDIRSELAKFRNHHEAHGKQMSSWDAAWRTWCDRFNGYKPNGNGTSQKRSFTTVAHDAIDRIEAQLNAQGGGSRAGTFGSRVDTYPSGSQPNFELLTAPDFGVASRKR